MNGRRPPAHLALFGTVSQPRFREPEPWPLYLAVIALRERGHRVFRAGFRTHSVDGERVYSAKALIRFAEEL